jgi:hypothetical protein
VGVGHGHIEVPEEVLALLGEDPEREALEAVLLHLIRADRASVAWAGTRLGLGRQEAIRWYTSHGYPFPDITPEEFDEELRHAESAAKKYAKPKPRTAEEQASLEVALEGLRVATEALTEETGMSEDELADLFDPSKPLPEDPRAGGPGEDRP